MTVPRHKRLSPTQEQIAWRSDTLLRLAGMPVPQEPSGDLPPQFELGNSKVGQSGTFAQTVFVWNLPAKATCPGASSWCSSLCYNADPRTKKFPVNAWIENWAWLLHRPDALKKSLLTQLSLARAPVIVRVHSSGDFFSRSYIDFWRDMVEAVPTAKFWAYTRSWVDNELKTSLEELRALPNIEVFASWDVTMPPPPADWRVSFVVDDNSVPPDRNYNLVCPEQDGRLPNCASCGYCFTKRSGDVTFDVH